MSADPSTVWVTKEGVRIPIRRMDNRHLQNVLRMLWRLAPNARIAAITNLEGIASVIHGEQASYSIDQEIDNLMEMCDDDFLSYSIAQYDALMEEAERRGLLSDLLKERDG